MYTKYNMSIAAIYGETHKFQNVTISDCIAKCSITSTTTGSMLAHIGTMIGLVVNTSNVLVENSNSYSTIYYETCSNEYEYNYIGGAIGEVLTGNATLQNCFFNDSITGPTSSCTGYYYIGGLISVIAVSANITILSTTVNSTLISFRVTGGFITMCLSETNLTIMNSISNSSV